MVTEANLDEKTKTVPCSVVCFISSPISIGSTTPTESPSISFPAIIHFYLGSINGSVRGRHEATPSTTTRPYQPVSIRPSTCTVIGSSVA